VSDHRDLDLAMNTRVRFLLVFLTGLALAWAAVPVGAGYKARAWSVGAREGYPASLTSEGVTIAADPLFTDALAARVFDKDDIVTRGIMPLAILIFNDNDFPVEVDGSSIELIHGEDHVRTLAPNEVVYRLFRRDKSWINQQIPKASRSELNRDALDDFDNKFLMDKAVAPHDKGGGFLYLHIPEAKDLASYLSNALVYIPKIYRQDDGSRLIFFEIALQAAIGAAPRG
jgi:hypothetical protein